MIYLWRCTHCDTYQETEQSMKDTIKPPTSCDCEAPNIERIYEAPAVRTRTSRTFLDGMRKDKAWVEAKRALHLEGERANANSEEDRAAIAKDIRKIRTLK
jgi:putative FmdB family regulatory protein